LEPGTWNPALILAPDTCIFPTSEIRNPPERKNSASLADVFSGGQVRNPTSTSWKKLPNAGPLRAAGLLLSKNQHK